MMSISGRITLRKQYLALAGWNRAAVSQRECSLWQLCQRRAPHQTSTAVPANLRSAVPYPPHLKTRHHPATLHSLLRTQVDTSVATRLIATSLSVPTAHCHLRLTSSFAFTFKLHWWPRHSLASPLRPPLPLPPLFTSHTPSLSAYCNLPSAASTPFLFPFLFAQISVPISPTTSPTASVFRTLITLPFPHTHTHTLFW